MGRAKADEENQQALIGASRKPGLLQAPPPQPAPHPRVAASDLDDEIPF
jgi:hypothetical protein